jgi:hypothetical protein
MIMRSIVVEVEASDVVALDRKDSRFVLTSPREADGIAAAGA